MELHRHWKLHLRGPLWLLGGGFFLAAPTVVFPLIGYELPVGNWLAYPMGVVALFIGGLGLQTAHQRFLLRFDRGGVAWQIGADQGVLPWHRVVRFAIERAPDDPPRATPNDLMLWVRERLPSAGPPQVR